MSLLLYKRLIQLYLSLLWLLLPTHFITRVTYIDDIDSKSPKMELKSSCYFSTSGVDTHIHIVWRNESDFKKPGAPATRLV